MSYSNITVTKFQGLNSTIAPELIPDGAARDICNLRMEKVGKLVSRDGYKQGLYTMYLTCGYAKVTGVGTNMFSPTSCFMQNAGIIGIGEFILAEKWDLIDSDRMMVYVIRGEAADREDEKRNKECYLFSPLTGKFKNYLLTEFSGAYPTGYEKFPEVILPNGEAITAGTDKPQITVTNKRDANAQGSGEDEVQLYAPNRDIPTIVEDDDRTNDPWIEHYIDMNQYRHQLVISDRINGDMLLEDEFNAGGANTCDDAEHELHLRPNCLETFEIDYVTLDARFGTLQENDLNEGVENGMGLYQFELPEEEIKVTRDYADNMIGNPEWLLNNGNSADSGHAIKLLQDYINNSSNQTHLAIGITIDTDSSDAYALSVNKNTDNDYIFSNGDPGKFNNIGGKLKFHEEDYIDEDGKVKKESAPNVYIWDDMKLQYYPCSGIDEQIDSHGNTNYQYYLRDIDREFQKLTSEVPRIVRINAKDNAGNTVPLGVWRYKFVWDFGNGVYSAPSAEMLCPDMMWSALRDSEVHNSYDYRRRQFLDEPTYEVGNLRDVEGNYLCDTTPRNHDAEEKLYHYISDTDPDHATYPNHGLILPFDSPPIWANATTLTKYGQLLYNIKKQLYSKEHLYGYQEDDLATLYTDWDDTDLNTFNTFLKHSNLGVLATCYFSKTNLPLKGTYWEGAAIINGDYGGSAWESQSGNPWVVRKNSTGVPKIIENFGGIIVPIFQTANDFKTINSVFDDYGRCRLAWTDRSRTHLIFPKYGIGIGEREVTDYIGGSDKVIYDIIGESSDNSLYIALVTDETTSPYFIANYPSSADVVWWKDKNNSTNTKCGDDGTPEVYYAKFLRSNSMLRAVKNESDRLINVKTTDADSDALSRLILQGMCELPVLLKGENIYYEQEYAIQYAVQTAHTLDSVYDWGEDSRGWETGGVADPWQQRHHLQEITGTYADVPVPSVTISSCTKVQPETNVSVYIYGQGERLTALEQLTSYFPSSLLFGSPRMAIKIPQYDDDGNKLIPDKAKRLLIFRTKCSHANDWEPNTYGLVADVEIPREEGSTEILLETNIENQKYPGIYYFDKIKDADLDFGYNPSDYDGLIHPLQSRFNMPLNERVYYLNFIETYQPQSPRQFRDYMLNDSRIGYNDGTIEDFPYNSEYPDWKHWHEGINSTSRFPVDNTHGVVLESTNDEGYSYQLLKKYIRYCYAYRDSNGILSDVKFTQIFYISASEEDDPNEVVVLYLMPSGYDESIKHVEVYRCISSYPYYNDKLPEITDYLEILPDETTADVLDRLEFYKIGKVEHPDEGIFVDTWLKNGERLTCVEPSVENYESGLRWSEPYRPDWIKNTSFVEYRAGDGRQGTGLEGQYGNLVIFKETSMHRVAVQSKNPDLPLSRTDEVTSEIGVIAPNACINVNNTLYFLSWKGFMKYDNNILEKIDGPFDEELQHILQTNSIDALRDASCGYNSAYNEIYLNIPMLPTLNADLDRNGTYERQDLWGQSKYYEHYRKLYGHIYVINIDKQYATKFSYCPTLKGYQRVGDEYIYYKEVIHPETLLRMYYTNSLGELRSGDIFPNIYGSLQKALSYDADGNIVVDDGDGFVWASMFIESPYKLDKYDELYADVDYEVDIQTILQNILDTYGTRNPAGASFDDWVKGNLELHTSAYLTFPLIKKGYPIRSIFKSKFFTGENETMLKRVRLALANMYSRGEIKMRGITVPYEVYDERIDNLALSGDYNEFAYNPSMSGNHPFTGQYFNGTNRSVLTFVPETPYKHWVKDDVIIERYNDYYAKPLRFSMEIESELRTQINQISIYWRPIHTYLA